MALSLNRKVVLLGAGRMGSAVLQGLVRDPQGASQVLSFYEVHQPTADAVVKSTGVKQSVTLEEALAPPNNEETAAGLTVVFAVKPQVLLGRRASTARLFLQGADSRVSPCARRARPAVPVGGLLSSGLPRCRVRGGCRAQARRIDRFDDGRRLVVHHPRRTRRRRRERRRAHDGTFLCEHSACRPPSSVVSDSGTASAGVSLRRARGCAFGETLPLRVRFAWRKACFADRFCFVLRARAQPNIPLTVGMGSVAVMSDGLTDEQVQVWEFRVLVVWIPPQ